MLSLMRKHSKSFIIYVFFGIIIAVFVVNFGPQSAGCTAGTSYAGKLSGQPITVADFAYAQAVWGLKSQQGTEEQLIQMRQLVMDKLIARELLAADALEMGINIPNKEIDDTIFRGRYLALGSPRPLIRGDNDEFDYERFSRYARYYWGVTVRRFKFHQRRELLADKLRQFLRTTVKVSEDEVKSDFILRNTKIKLDYVRITPDAVASQIKLDDATIKAWADKNKDKIKQHYEANKNAYQKKPKQFKLQIITVNHGADKAKAKAKATALLRQVKGGKAFGALAAASSDHPSKSRKGQIGWRTVKDTGLGVEASRAIGKLAPKKTSELIEEASHFLIARVLDQREGDLSLAQATEEISRELYLKEKGQKLLVDVAAGFIKRVKGGEKLGEILHQGWRRRQR